MSWLSFVPAIVWQAAVRLRFVLWRIVDIITMINRWLSGRLACWLWLSIGWQIFTVSRWLLTVHRWARVLGPSIAKAWLRLDSTYVIA